MTRHHDVRTLTCHQVRAVAALLGALLLAALVAFAAPAARAAEPIPAPVPSAVADPAAGQALDPAAPAAPCALGTVACADTAVPAAPAVMPAVDPLNTNLLSGVANDTAQAATTVLSDTFGWWLRTSSLPVESQGVLAMQATLLGLAGVVLTLLVIVQGIRMMMTRKGAPFAELIRGMLVASLVIVAGVALVDSALIASDRIADEIIRLAFPDSDALVKRMVDVMLGAGVTGQAPVLLLVFSLIVLTAGLLQAVLMFLRQCAIPMFGALLPIAAVGQAGPPATQRWLPRLLNAIVAIVLYKPVVALILSLGFVQFSDEATLVDAIRGSVMLAMSVAAFFLLLRLFAPATHALAHRGAHGLAVLGPMVSTSFAARGAGTPGDTTAVQQAAFMSGRGRTSAVVAGDGASVSVASAAARMAEPPSADVVAFPRVPGRGDPLGDTRAAEVADAGSPVVPLRAAEGGTTAARGAEPPNERSRHGH